MCVLAHHFLTWSWDQTQILKLSRQHGINWAPRICFLFIAEYYYFMILILHILFSLFFCFYWAIYYFGSPLFLSPPLLPSPMVPTLPISSGDLVLFYFPYLPSYTSLNVKGSSVCEHCFHEHRRVTVSWRPREIKLLHHVVILLFNFSFGLQHWFPERWCHFPFPPTARHLSFSS